MRSQCPFYEHEHTAETWDEMDQQIMACRDRQREEVGVGAPRWSEQPTVTTEMAVADAATLVMPCLRCNAVTVVEGGLCEKCADAGQPKVC